MGNYTLLQKRPTGYYFRQVVPQDLRKTVGKKEIIQSLKTKDKAEAVRKHKELAAYYSQYFNSLIHGEPTPTIPTVADGETAAVEATISPIKRIQVESNATTTGRGKSLDWLAEEWIKEKAPADRQFKKAGFARRVVRMFQDVHGNILIGELDAQLLIEFKKALQNDTSSMHLKCTMRASLNS